MAADDRVARALNVDEGFSSALSDGDRSALADLVQDYFCSDPANHKHAHSNENDFNIHGSIDIDSDDSDFDGELEDNFVTRRLYIPAFKNNYLLSMQRRSLMSKRTCWRVTQMKRKASQIQLNKIIF